MKENINFDNNSQPITTETELLRKDTKHLIYSLKKNQDVVKEQISKLRDENNQFNLEQDYLTDSTKSLDDYEIKYTRNIQEDEQYNIEHEVFQLGSECKKSFNKSVSFNQFLMGRSASSNRRSRSVSPHLSKTPTKSILKKQLVEDELSDAADELINSSNDDDVNNSSSNSTNSLLCSDIYGDFEKDFEFDSMNIFPTTAAAANGGGAQFNGTQIKKNTNKLIDSINRKRQSYLNHMYSESVNGGSLLELNGSKASVRDSRDYSSQPSTKSNRSASHSHLSPSDEADSSSNRGSPTKIKPSKIPVKNSLQTIPWSRPKSADNNNKEKVIQLKQVSSAQSRLNKFHLNNSHISRNKDLSTKPTKSQQQQQPQQPATVAKAQKQQVSVEVQQQKVAANVGPKLKLKLASSLARKGPRDYKKLASQIKKTKPLLGYDWAVDEADLEANSNGKTGAVKLAPKSEEYWQELSMFRAQNKDDCMSSKQPNFDGSTASFFDMDSKMDMTNELNGTNKEKDPGAGSGEDGSRGHKCIHSYTLNDRLFPVPVYKGKNGQSACPVCKSSRKEATSFTPQYCKVSIPKSRIMEPYKIQFNKEVSEDSVSLAGLRFPTLKNCKAGYQSGFVKKNSNGYGSKPASSSKTVDLRSASGINSELSKLTIDDVKRIQQNRDPAVTGVYNKAHVMRYDLEDQHQKRLREFAT